MHSTYDDFIKNHSINNQFSNIITIKYLMITLSLVLEHA